MPLRRTLTVPLKGQLFPGTSQVCLWADLPLFLRTTRNAFVARDFRVDTAAHISEVGDVWARQIFLPIHGPVVTWSVTTGSGTTQFTGQLGTICVRLPLWTGIEFERPCFFRHSRPANLPPQLGLAGVIDDIRLTVDGTASPTARYGSLTVEQH